MTQKVVELLAGKARSPISPSKAFPAQLVEESDAGSYIVEPRTPGRSSFLAVRWHSSTFLIRWQIHLCSERLNKSSGARVSQAASRGARGPPLAISVSTISKRVPHPCVSCKGGRRCCLCHLICQAARRVINQHARVSGQPSNHFGSSYWR